jgi:ferredoxin-type protein NapG
VPIVNSDYCTGCGICEQACPTDEAAVRVVQPELVQGKIGAHYRLGWTVDTPVTQDFIPGREAVPPVEHDVSTGLDYLNEDNLRSQ